MVYLSSAEANTLRWTPDQKGRYEVYYLTLNHLDSRTGYWIRYTLPAPADGGGEPHPAVWFSFFDLHRPDAGFGLPGQVPGRAIQSSRGPLSRPTGASPPEPPGGR